MIYLSTFLLALFLSMALIPLCARAAEAFGIMDVPDARKVHARPIPRTGGVALAAAALIPLLLWAPPAPMGRAVLLGSALVVFFGFADDVWNLGYRVKFAGQVAAALVVIFHGGVRIHSLGALLPGEALLPEWASVALTLVAIVGVTNAINLTDGLDGLAGGISALGFGATAYLAYLSGNAPVAVKATAVAGATLGFLRFNTHPATVFMGDAGSQFLGFMAITLALAVTQGPSPLSPLVPLLLLGFPVLDTLAVMAGRVIKGKSPFVADKNHFHHKLLRLGFHHADAVRVIYLIQMLLVGAAVLLRFHSEWLLVGGYTAFSASLVGGLALADRRSWRVGEYGRFKTGLRTAKEGGALIQGCFRALLLWVPALLLVSCATPGSVPALYALLAGALAALLLGFLAFARDRAASAVRLVVYLSVPLVVYLGESDAAGWFVAAGGGRLALAFNVAFAGMVVLAILVIRLTRRQTFQSTPLDLLILLVALVVPSIQVGAENMGLVTAKIIALFFGYEVLLTELRGRVRWLGATTLGALALLAAKGFW